MWVIYYVIVFFILCNSYIEDEKYSSGLDDFKGMIKGNKFVGDPESNTKIKYLSFHLLVYLLSMPLAWFSYHNFIFNCCYIFIIVTFVMWSAGKSEAKHIEKKVKEKIRKQSLPAPC